MKLHEVKLRYVRYVLFLHNGSRKESAKYLGISVRGLRNFINEMKDEDIPEDKPEEDFKIDWNFKFPTNEERLAYLNSPTYRGI